MKISDLILVQKGKSSQLGILLALKQNQLESISASGHLMIHSKRDVTFASPEWGKSLSPSPIHSLPQILPTNQKKIINAGMEVSVLLHLQRFHRAAVMMQQKISPLISDFHSTLDPSIYLDLDTITTSLFKTSPPTPAQKYAVTRALEDTLYFIKNLDPYNPVFRPRPEEEIKEIKQLLNLRIDLPLEIQDFIKKSQSLIKSFRSG